MRLWLIKNSKANITFRIVLKIIKWETERLDDLHCEKFLLENLKVGIDVAIFLFQLVVQIQTLVFLDQVPTHL